MIDRRDSGYKCRACEGQIYRDEDAVECMGEYFHEGCFEGLGLSDFLDIIGETSRSVYLPYDAIDYEDDE